MNGSKNIPTDLLQIVKSDGFAIIKLSPSDQRIIDATIAEAQQFFRSPIEERLKGRLPGDLGYRGFAEEYSLSRDRPDQMESFSASFKGLEKASLLCHGASLVLYARMLATINILEPLAEAVLQRLAEQVLVDKAVPSFEGGLRWWSFLQLNYSFPSRVREELINELHEDGCLLTLACATAPGLEVQTPRGEIIPVTTAPDEILVMPSEILWLLSAGALTPLYHRVRPYRSYAERASLLYFADLDPKMCHPWVESEINKGVDIGERVLKNPTRYGLEQWRQ